MTRSELAERIQVGAIKRYQIMSDDELMSNYRRGAASAMAAEGRKMAPDLRLDPSNITIYATLPPTPTPDELRRRAIASISAPISTAADEDELINGFVNCLDCGEIPPAKILDPLIGQAREEMHLLYLLETHPQLNIHQYIPNSTKPSHRPEVKLFTEPKK
jgi:hypothetical protein